MMPQGHALPGDADLVILSGTKPTRGDLAFLCAQGWDVNLHAHVWRGGQVLAVCGGYQMLGHTVADPDRIKRAAGVIPGLSLLDAKTVMSADNALACVSGTHLATRQAVAAYEIQIGRTTGPPPCPNRRAPRS